MTTTTRQLWAAVPTLRCRNGHHHRCPGARTVYSTQHARTHTIPCGCPCHTKEGAA